MCISLIVTQESETKIQRKSIKFKRKFKMQFQYLFFLLQKIQKFHSTNSFEDALDKNLVNLNKTVVFFLLKRK